LFLERRQARLDSGPLLGELAGDRGVLLGKLLERLEIVDPRLELSVGGQPPPDSRVLGRDLRRSTLVVPEARLAELLLERLEALAQRGWVKDNPRAA